MKTPVVVAQSLSEDVFRPYGQILRMSAESELPGGHFWNTWITWPQVDPPLDTFGTVVTKKPLAQIDTMEAHTCQELLVPISGPIVQPLALGADMADVNAVPPLDTIVAFIVEPGEAILINAGIWHSPALPYRCEQVVYHFMFPRQTMSPGPTAHRMIPFGDNRGFQVAD